MRTGEMLQWLLVKAAKHPECKVETDVRGEHTQRHTHSMHPHLQDWRNTQTRDYIHLTCCSVSNVAMQEKWSWFFYTCVGAVSHDPGGGCPCLSLLLWNSTINTSFFWIDERMISKKFSLSKHFCSLNQEEIKRSGSDWHIVGSVQHVESTDRFYTMKSFQHTCNRQQVETLSLTLSTFTCCSDQ